MEIPHAETVENIKRNENDYYGYTKKNSHFTNCKVRVLCLIIRHFALKSNQIPNSALISSTLSVFSHVKSSTVRLISFPLPSLNFLVTTTGVRPT